MNDTEGDERTRALIAKGVVIPCPATVEIGDGIDPDMIAPGVVIHAGCRISGRKTSVMAGTELGREAPVTIDDCQIGRNVELKGGYFKQSVFLDGSNLGLGAHVREACILEEEAGGAHTVGLKHTVLLPFVTLGSLINLCDCLMAGGTSRKNHSEVGSSYIHFNYTPNQDKATPSLIGDVPRGVMLSERPIFLGGQGGLVGPAVIAFGSVVPAGTIMRGDLREPGKIVLEQALKSEVRDFHPGLYREMKRRLRNNIAYIGNLIALKAWYRLVRSQFFGPDLFEQALLRGALEKLDLAIYERIRRLDALAAKMPESVRQYSDLMKVAGNPIHLTRMQELFENRDALSERLQALQLATGDETLRDDFLVDFMSAGTVKAGYVETIQGLTPETKAIGTRWLENIVAQVMDSALDLLPSYR